MKYIYNFILLFLILLISCDGDKSPLEPNHPMSFITNALTEYIVGAEPSSDFGIEFIVESPLNSKIKSNQNWCKIEIDKNKKLNVKLVVDDNVTNKERVARVVISSPEIENAFLILVKQRALAFEMTNLEDAFTPEGGEYDVFIGSNDSWTIECDVDWVNLSTASGESTDGLSPAIVKLVVGPNNDGIVRSANFILKSSSGKEFTKEVYQNEPWDTRVRIGDEGVQFDESRFDPTYALFPQMIEWKTAGRTVGIPLLNEQISNIDKTFGPENTVEEINAYLEAGDKYQKRIILLKAGEYTIDKSIRLYSQDVLIGERKDGVILKLSGDGAISMFNENNIGLRNLTIKGAWSDKDPDPTDMSETLPSEKEKHQTVSMSRTKESYVDNVRIINSASHPIIISGNVDNNGEGSHNTIRDVEIDGCIVLKFVYSFCLLL